ncbi:conjugal transfer protein TraF, partial [bacterium]|nr:conjugal transfer protein TraF [bacterium]
MFFRYFCLACLSLALVTTLEGVPLTRLYRSPRVTAMGGAFTAVADDHNALFINPAGFARMSKGNAFLPLGVGVGADTMDTTSELMDLDYNNGADVAAFLQSHLGEFLSIQADFLPRYIGEGWGVAGFGLASINGAISNSAFPEISFNSYTLYGATGAFGFSLGETLDGGVGVRLYGGSRINETYTLAQIALGDFDQMVEDDLVDASGVGFDVGLLWDAPWGSTVGLAWTDVGGTDLGDAAALPGSLNLGLAHEVGPGLLALDVVDLLLEDATDEDLMKRIHLGYEFNEVGPFRVGVGLHQGYFSAGVGFKLGPVIIEYTTYGE